jgi:hypothetical protein
MLQGMVYGGFERLIACFAARLDRPASEIILDWTEVHESKKPSTRVGELT